MERTITKTYEKMAMRTAHKVLKRRGYDNPEELFPTWLEFKRYMLETKHVVVMLHKLSLTDDNFMMAFRRFSRKHFNTIRERHYDCESVAMDLPTVIVFPWKSLLYCATDHIEALTYPYAGPEFGHDYCLDPIMILDSGNLVVTTFQNYLMTAL